MSNTKSFREILEKQGLSVPDEKVYIKIQNAKSKMIDAFNEFLPDFEWIKEYDEVAEWLTDNKGKGLLLFGNCGRGKTILAKYILPALILKENGKVVNYFDVQNLKANIDDVLKRKIFTIDDVGTEEVLNDFGTRRDVFPDIIDFVEKKSKLIIITSNLTRDQLEKRYGIRTMDRLVQTTKRIVFCGKSFRK